MTNTNDTWLNAGVPRGIICGSPVPHKRIAAVRNVTRTSDGKEKIKEIDRTKQIAFLTAFLESRGTVPCCFGFSSLPNDYLAKLMAFQTIKRMGLRTLWIPVIGNYAMDIRRKRLGTELIVLTNVLWGSTDLKIEICRDMLEIHQHIPRIVVTSGDNALRLFNERLNVPLNGFVHLN